MQPATFCRSIHYLTLFYCTNAHYDHYYFIFAHRYIVPMWLKTRSEYKILCWLQFQVINVKTERPMNENVVEALNQDGQQLKS